MLVRDVFETASMSISEILFRAGTGFYIPPYQREYTWAQKDINRLFDDCYRGIRMLLTKSDSITFMGSLIVIHDTEYASIKPHNRGEIPGHVS